MADTTQSSPASSRIRPGKTILAPVDQDTGADENALLLGIVLGTSRSSIVSLAGARKTVESYVGYAKDPVSRKLLKADIIYGKHALDNRLAVDLFRPLEKGVIKGTLEEGSNTEEQKKNLDASKMLLKHLVDLVHPERDQVLYGVVGVPSRATTKNKQAILEIAREVLDSVMIVSEPFTVAYGIERMSDNLVIDIGAGTTD
jgi:rod shape-determining protein MreB